MKIREIINEMKEEKQQTLDWNNWVNRFALLQRILKQNNKSSQ